MSKSAKTRVYNRLNKLTHNYIVAVNENYYPEVVHGKLRSFLVEAISVDVTLPKVLKALSNSDLKDANTPEFIDNISSHYSRLKTETKKRERCG